MKDNKKSYKEFNREEEKNINTVYRKVMCIVSLIFSVFSLAVSILMLVIFINIQEVVMLKALFVTLLFITVVAAAVSTVLSVMTVSSGLSKLALVMNIVSIVLIVVCFVLLFK